MINFNSVTLHNFGSYRHAEIVLRNKGFCLVSGENHRKEDNALSNGSGKSMCWSAICFALTGETIQGVKSGLKNICNDEPEAYVELDFDVDRDHYLIRRIIAPHSDLKIEKNGLDVSGKGIRESEAKLAELLPDITPDLLTSSILIGQGMPNKFSSFKPSGRKEILEKLTKSDFMIADMKARIESRKNALADRIKETSDKSLIVKTKCESYKLRLKSLSEKRLNLIKPDFDKIINEGKAKLAASKRKCEELQESIERSEVVRQTLNDRLMKANLNKNNEKTALLQRYASATLEDKNRKASLETELRLAKNDLAKIKAHPDICPTCGQKLPNVEHIKQEKVDKEKKILELSESLTAINKLLSVADNAKDEQSKRIDESYRLNIEASEREAAGLKAEIGKMKANLVANQKQADIAKDEIRNAEARKESWDSEQARLAKEISDIETESATLEKEQKDLVETLDELNAHLTVVKQLEILTKRDFRGYILSDVIKYVDERAKDFAETIFKHRDLNIYLDGNDLDISYNGKMLDNLSGGERQRVDLITQFAIRDLLVNHLNMGSNILVLDEITDFLDKTSCDAVMSLVEKELNSVESVFIVSHHAESLGIAVDSELKIVKDEAGISSVLIN